MSKLFVYGTLKRGHRAHDFLGDDSVFLREAKTHSRYHLYQLGWFPGMVIDEMIDGGVQGELYEVTDECLSALDTYEGAPDLFRREDVELEDGNVVISYIYMREFSATSRIENGIWKVTE